MRGCRLGCKFVCLFSLYRYECTFGSADGAYPALLLFCFIPETWVGLGDLRCAWLEGLVISHIDCVVFEPFGV